MFGGDESQISEKDQNYYNDMMENLDYDSYKELRDRGNKAAWDLVALRENMQGGDADALNWEASWSDPALDMDIFSQMSSEMAYSTGGNQYNEEMAEKEAKAQGKSDWFTEDSKKQKQAAKILDANYMEEVTKGNRHLQKLRETDAGRKEVEERKADRGRRYMDIYRGKKKKKKKGWFSRGG